jgi:hypothetical protein
MHRSHIVTGSQKHRDPRFTPRAFTQEGVAMLSGVLRSKRAVEINVAIMRAFVRLREILATHEELARKVAQHDRHIAVLFEHVKSLLERSPRRTLARSLRCPPPRTARDHGGPRAALRRRRLRASRHPLRRVRERKRTWSRLKRRWKASTKDKRTTRRRTCSAWTLPLRRWTRTTRTLSWRMRTRRMHDDPLHPYARCACLLASANCRLPSSRQRR